MINPAMGCAHVNLHNWHAAFTLAVLSMVLSAAGEGTSPPVVLKYENPASLTGNILARGGTNVLFKFKRTAARSGTNLNVLREFTYPDGKLAARESVTYHGDRLVTYKLEELQTGGKGSATIMGATDAAANGSVEFKYTARAGSRTQTARETLQPNTLMSDMVAPFINDHWAELMAGKEVTCRFLVIPRRETIGFKFAKHAETTRDSKPVVVIRMTPTSWFIDLAVDPLDFTVEKEVPHRILQYTGRTTPKIKSGSKWNDLNAVTVFEWVQP